MAEPRYGEERKQMGSIVGDRPKISVIMGVYNGADRVDEAIASIRVQTFTDWEFIICDDASTDNTWEKLVEWSKIDSRIVPIRNEKNMKLAATLNKCLEHASGSYIARMDDDDYSYPWRLKQAKAQEEQAKIQFQTTLLKAGNEVSNALYQYQMTSDKAVSREIQVNSARKAAEDTKELFNLGTSTYLEVLSAEQSYLSAQLSEVADTFDRMQSVISLYQALGGGREK